ncbi:MULTISPECIES: class I SAM-dependent methyltransferase [unclassified Acidovorax]|uniref:class I SAM-dependent methyltransferase n=1 Tax=unclassified Acidovorax TaxID=2684926 RepID=UPI0006F57FBC|nr:MULTISPECIES: class I SAM-dependent methyltransferase [unclassified Acidovorax]KRB38307.1 ubiquinone biosynthesis protein UbiE [Acidovorax sp. Root70]PUA96114.1 methyltransferase family protein [Acidovorax sp. 107]
MSSPDIAPVPDALPSAAARPAAASKAQFWDRIAPKYAADPIADLAGYEATLQRVQGLLSTQQEVLEIGCGTGSTALRLAPFTRSLLATDVSPEMIAIAHQRLAAQPSPQLRFAVADAEATYLGQEVYDAVLAFNVLHLTSDLNEALKRLVLALRPGGLLISKTACIAEMNPLIPYLAVPLMRAIGKAPPLLCLDEQRLRSAMLRQGLQIVCVERHGTRGKDTRAFVVARKPG